MTQPNEQLIETIQRSLRQSEVLPSHRDFVAHNADGWLRSLLEEINLMKQFLKAEQQDLSDLHEEYMKECKALQQTREELEKLKVHARRISCSGLCKSQSDDYCGIHQVGEECPGCRNIWFKAHQENETLNLLTELDTKNMVLGWYAQENNYRLGVMITLGTAHPMHEAVMTDNGDRARSVLSSYPPREKGADNEQR